MELDAFTVFAQMLNFVVLLLVMKRFLYRPVLLAMEGRESDIQRQLDDASAQSERATAASKRSDELEASLAARRSALEAEASQAAAQLKSELLAVAREEGERAREQWRSAIETERVHYLDELQERVGQQACEIARRALSDLAGEELEQAVVAEFLRRIRRQSEGGDESLAERLRTSESITVRSAFELHPDQRAALREALGNVSQTEATVQFEVDSELLCGIECRAHGYKLAWSVRDHLNSLEEVLFVQAGAS